MSEFLPGASLHYKAGRENLVPDALSRRPDFLAALKLATEDGVPLAFCNSVVSVESILLSCLVVMQERDSLWRECAHLAGSQNGQWQFLEAGGVQVICGGGKVWVPEAMVSEILTIYHDDRGHIGVKRTVQMIQEKFWIPKITGVVSEYIRKCDTC